MSNPRPLVVIPTYADNANYPAGPNTWNTNPTKRDPSLGERVLGREPGQQLPAQWENWTKNAQGQWLNFLADVGLLNWYPALTKDTAAAALILSAARANGPAKMFWSQNHQVWIVTGKATNNEFYTAVPDFITATATGLSISDKLTFGCEAGEHVLLFTAAIGTGNSRKMARSAANSLTSFTTITLPSAGGANDNVQDVIYTSSVSPAPNRVIAIGGVAGEYTTWLSTDDGATFVQITITPGVKPTNYLSDLYEDPVSGRVYAWVSNTTAANGGDKFWYTDDGGSNWSAGASLGFDLIQSLHRTASGDYIITRSSNSEIKIIPNPILNGAVTTIPGGGVVSYGPLTGQGREIILQITKLVSPAYSELGLTWNSFAGNRVLKRLFGAINNIAVNPDGQYAVSGNGFFSTSLTLSGFDRGE
jgi:hypothetical protein